MAMDLLILFALATILVACVWNSRDLRRRIDGLANSRSAVLESADVEALMESELERARRLNYPLSVITIRPDEHDVGSTSSNPALAQITERSNRQRASAVSVNLFGSATESGVGLRATDVAVYDKQQRSFVVLLIGAAKVDAEKVAERISLEIARIIQQPLRYGCAEFPQDNYIFADLIKSAEASRRSTQTPRSQPQRPTITEPTDVKRA